NASSTGNGRTFTDPYPPFFASHSSACFIQATNHAGHDGSSDISEVYHTERRLGGCKVWNGTRKKRSPPSGGLPSRLSLDVQAQRVQQRAVGKPVIIVIPPHAAVFFPFVEHFPYRFPVQHARHHAQNGGAVHPRDRPSGRLFPADAFGSRPRRHAVRSH